MRRLAALVLVCGCSDDVATEPDAGVDARTGDARMTDAEAPVPTCTPTGSREPPPPAVTPVAGTYCATWTRVSGILDAFPRYYDRVDVTLVETNWRTSGGKEWPLAAGVVGGCLELEPFVGPGEVSGSDRVRLCWQSSTVALGTMAWCSAQITGEQWNVRLDACP